MKGKLITLEGPDGSGKSTLLALLSEYFEKKGIAYIATREPGGTSIGEKIRNIIIDNANSNMSAQTEALLFAASRAQHVYEKIQPALLEGKLVLCDRFLFSSLAYQGVGRGLGIEEVKCINEFGIRGLKPDLVLFMHVDPELTLKRKMLEGGDRLEVEGSSFHKRVYEGYAEVIKKYSENVVTIDASLPADEVFAQAINIINEYFKGEVTV